jgi:hypothetical protein
VKRLGRRVEEKHVMLSATGRLVMLATAPGQAHRRVRPVLAARARRVPHELQHVRSRPSRRPGPRDRRHDAERLGQQGHLPDQPRATRYRKKTAQGPGAESALNFDISVTKDEFFAGEEVELRRLIGGDFAYVMSWGRRAERMARARVFLRNELVTTILEAGESGYWGSSSELATGIDGQPFFSATHKVHPATRRRSCAARRPGATSRAPRSPSAR